MQEQNVLFMASLWLYAVFVSPSDATDLGYAYLILRSMYPVVWAVLGGEKGMPEAGSMFTFPQYAINVFEVLSVVLKLQYAPRTSRSSSTHHSPLSTHSLHSPPSILPLTTPLLDSSLYTGTTTISRSSSSAIRRWVRYAATTPDANAQPALHSRTHYDSCRFAGAAYSLCTCAPSLYTAVFAFNIGFMTYAMGVIGMLSESVFAKFFAKAKK